MALATTLNELDGLPTLLLSVPSTLIERAEELAIHAREQLEKLAVAFEDGREEFTEPKALRTLKMFVKYGDDLLKNPQLLLNTHCEDLDLVDILLTEFGTDPSVNENHVLRQTALTDNVAVVDRLLQDTRVNPAALNNAAIRYAASNGHVAVVDRLLQDARVDPSAMLDQALRDASMNGHVAVVGRLLQDDRVDPSAMSDTALQLAAAQGHLEIVELLLQHKRSYINAVGVCFSVGVHRAIAQAFDKNHLAVADRLLERVVKRGSFISTICYRLQEYTSKSKEAAALIRKHFPEQVKHLDN